MQTANRRALILVTVWPEPESSAAGWRVMNMIEALQGAGYLVTVASPSRENAFSERLGRSQVEVKPVRLNDSSFDAWVAEQGFEVAILDRFVIEEQFGWRIREHSPSTLRVLDTEDLHFLRRAREKALRSGAALKDIFEDRIDLQTDDACREIAAIHRCDLTLVLSDHELDLLLLRFKVDPELLTLFRFCYRDYPQTPGFQERSDFSVIGNFRHAPNADGTRWLKTEVWPRIRAKFKSLLPAGERLPEVHVFGAYPSREEMAATDAKAGFFVKGPAPEVHQTLSRYRVNLAPLRFGAGIKGKISDGWRAGAPVVTTPVGAEGMRIIGPPTCFGGKVAEDPDAFAQAAVELYTNELEWQVARRQADRLLRKLFDAELNMTRLQSELARSLTHLSERRRRNFIGQMLFHQSLRSTEYFSRWIELKESRSSADGT